jgi:hypothetical protein
MTSVYTAGPDGRCTGCHRPEAEHAPQAWTADARACPPDEVTAETVTDEQIVLRASPATWDGLRCFEARALLRIATAEGDTVLAAHCSRGIKAGCLAKDSLRAIAAAINARAKSGIS